MKKTIILVLIALVGIGVGVGYKMATKEHDSTADLEAFHTATCDEIVQEFLDDEAASTAKYADKVIEVSGPIYEMDKTDGKVTSLKLSTDEFNIVSATFQSPLDVTQVSGDMVSVKGVCSGFNGDSESMLPGGTLELKRCTLVK